MRWQRRREADAATRAHENVLVWRDRRAAAYGEDLRAVDAILVLLARRSSRIATPDDVAAYVRRVVAARRDRAKEGSAGEVARVR